MCKYIQCVHTHNTYTQDNTVMYVYMALWHSQMISSEMTDLTLPLYSRNQKKQYGELRVGAKIFSGKVC